MATLIERVPPHNVDAEESVLGSLLMERDAVDRVLELLSGEDFYRPAHAKVFRACLDLNSRGQAIDLITLSDYLRGKNLLDEVGGSAALAGLTEKVPSAANVEYYARIVKDKARLRRLISTCNDIISDAYTYPEEAQNVVDTAENRILEVGNLDRGETTRQIQDVLHQVMGDIDKYQREKTHITGLASGFRDLDDITAGLHPGDYVIVAGRPGMGKTAFCLNVARNVAMAEKNPRPVLIFSIEMSSNALVNRLLVAEERIDAQRLRRGQLTQNEMGRITRGASRLYNAPIIIDDSAKLDIETFRARSRRIWKELKAKDTPLGLIVIDYVQMMEVREKKENRQQEITTISRGIKSVAKELGVPVIIASQLARAAEQHAKEASRPRLSDLRESGSLEQDADLVLLLYRSQYYSHDNNDKSATINIAKQRNGPTGDIDMVFFGEYARFEDAAPQGASEP